MSGRLILLIHCPDREGLAAPVTNVIRRFRGKVVDRDEHVDTERGAFCMRGAWDPASDDEAAIEQFRQAFVAEVPTPYSMTWRLERTSRRTRRAHGA